MDDQELFVIMFSGIFGSIGGIFFIIGMCIINSRKKKALRCTSSVWGKVKDITRHISHSTNGGRSSTYHPVYEYTIGNLTYVKESPYGISNLKFAIGQDVEIFYNPQDPHDYYVPSEKTANFLANIFRFIGGTFVIIAVVFAVVFSSCSSY